MGTWNMEHMKSSSQSCISRTHIGVTVPHDRYTLTVRRINIAHRPMVNRIKVAPTTLVTYSRILDS